MRWPVDTTVTNGLSFIVNSKVEVKDASILYEMSHQEGNEGSEGNNYEEW